MTRTIGLALALVTLLVTTTAATAAPPDEVNAPRSQEVQARAAHAGGAGGRGPSSLARAGNLESTGRHEDGMAGRERVLDDGNGGP
jgi:hypothetical protein